jgi:hypothetical protein
MVELSRYRYSRPPAEPAFETQRWISPRAKARLVKAAECERLSRSTLDEPVKGMYLDLAQRWRDLGNEAEMLDREHYRWFIDPHQ